VLASSAGRPKNN